MIRYRITKLENGDRECKLRIAPGTMINISLSSAPVESKEEFQKWIRNLYHKVRQAMRTAKREARRRQKIDRRLIDDIGRNVDIDE